MDKKKKEMILIIILIPLMAFMLYNNLVVGPRKKKQKARSRPPAEASSVSVQPAAQVKVPAAAGKKEGELPPLNEKLVQMQNRIETEPWGRDPFIPAPTPVYRDLETEGWKEFELEALIPGPGGGAAIIDGELIGVGEYYRGYRLSAVSKSRITLEKSGQSFILTMIEE